jgi:hypothetical protein
VIIVTSLPGTLASTLVINSVTRPGSAAEALMTAHESSRKGLKIPNILRRRCRTIEIGQAKFDFMFMNSFLTWSLWSPLIRLRCGR